MLKAGDTAPDFRLPDQDGKAQRLSELLAGKPLILYFYPADFTPGCTQEACDLRDLDLSGQLSVLADRGLQANMGPSVYKIAHWVMEGGREFVTADLAKDSRVAGDAVATVLAFPLTARGGPVGGELEFLDELTLAKAIENRREL